MCVLCDMMCVMWYVLFCDVCRCYARWWVYAYHVCCVIWCVLCVCCTCVLCCVCIQTRGWHPVSVSIALPYILTIPCTYSLEQRALDSACLAASSPPVHWDSRWLPHLSPSYAGSGDLSSVPHVHAAGVLLTEPTPQPLSPLLWTLECLHKWQSECLPLDISGPQVFPWCHPRKAMTLLFLH